MLETLSIPGELAEKPMVVEIQGDHSACVGKMPSSVEYAEEGILYHDADHEAMQFVSPDCAVDVCEFTEKPPMSNLFRAFRAIGCICSSIPCSYFKHSADQGQLAVALPSSYLILRCPKLVPVMHSRQFKDRISAIHTAYESTFVALKVSRVILMQHRCQTLGSFRGGHRADIVGMLTLNDCLLSWSQKEVVSWTISSFELRKPLPLQFQQPSQTVTCVLSYQINMNKVLVGFGFPGKIELWNYSTHSCIHRFSSVESALYPSYGDHVSNLEAVTVLSPTLHGDIVALGTQQGKVAMLDVVQDQIVQQFTQKQGAVTAMCCCVVQETGADMASVVLISGTRDGDLLVWSTNANCFLHCISGAHNAAVVTLIAVPQKPWFISTAKDNTIHMWHFQGTDLKPQPLRTRSGLTFAPTLLTMYDDRGKYMLGLTKTPNQRTEFARIGVGTTTNVRRFPQEASLKIITKTWKHPLSQLPSPVGLSCSSTRHHDWGNIISAHENLSEVFVWSGHDIRLLSKVLTLPPESLKRRPLPKPVAVKTSLCGNFAFVGYSDGQIAKFHLQAGTFRKWFKPPLSSADPVSFLLISEPKYLICISEFSLTINVYDYHRAEILYSIEMDKFKQYPQECQRIEKAALQYTLMTLVVSTRTKKAKSPYHCSVVILDIVTRQILRVVSPPPSDFPPSHVQLSPDSRWCTLSIDRNLYVYDIVSASLIDWVAFESPILTFVWHKNHNAFLYVSLEHLQGGLFVLSNHCCFETDAYHSLSRKTPTSPFYFFPSNDRCVHSGESAAHLEDNSDAHREVIEGWPPSNPETITISGDAISKTLALLYYDEIRARGIDRPEIQAPSDLPFFLPSAAEIDAKQLSAPWADTGKTDLPAALEKAAPEKPSELISKLTDPNPGCVAQFLDSLSAAALYRSFDGLLTGTDEDVASLCAAIFDSFLRMLSSKRHIDRTHAIFNVFLSTNFEALTRILQQPSSVQHVVLKRLRAINDVIQEDCDFLENRFNTLEFMLKFVTFSQFE